MLIHMLFHCLLGTAQEVTLRCFLMTIRKEHKPVLSDEILTEDSGNNLTVPSE